MPEMQIEVPAGKVERLSRMWVTITHTHTLFIRNTPRKWSIHYKTTCWIWMDSRVAQKWRVWIELIKLKWSSLSLWKPLEVQIYQRLMTCDLPLQTEQHSLTATSKNHCSQRDHIWLTLWLELRLNFQTVDTHERAAHDDWNYQGILAVERILSVLNAEVCHCSKLLTYVRRWLQALLKRYRGQGL